MQDSARRSRIPLPEGKALVDALIIGAGPVGCFVAEGLSRRGHRVLVVEEHPTVGLPSRCTGLIGEEAFSRFRLPEEPCRRRVRSIVVHGPYQTRLHLIGNSPLARVVDRPRLDAIMAHRAQEAGAEFLLGQRAQLARTDEEEAAIYLGESGKHLSGRVLVVAAGFSPLLTESLGLGRPPGRLLGAQVEAEIGPVEEVEVYVGQPLPRASFGWVVPTAGQTARIGVLTYHRPREWLDCLLSDERIRARLRRRLSEPVVAPLPLGTLPVTVGERVLAVGEAAGQVKATTGGGVYFGLRAAEAAVEVLDKALRNDDLSSSSLAEYERRWREIFGKEIEAGLKLRRLARRLDDRRIAFLLRLAAQNRLKEFLAASLSGFDWHASLVASRLAAERSL